MEEGPIANPGWDDASRLLRALAEEADRAPLLRKRLVCPTAGVGRELLRALSLRRGWIGFEVTTPLRLAEEIAGREMARRGLRRAGELEERARLDRAMDAALGAGDGRASSDGGAGSPTPGPYAELIDRPGFRDALASSVKALRLGGIDGAKLLRSDRGRAGRGRRAFLAAVLQRYESLLEADGLADESELLRLAISRLSGEEAALPDGALLLLPGLGRRALRGELLGLLLERGARVLPADPVVGLDVPAGILPPAPAEPLSRASWLHAVDRMPATEPGPGIELFAAASPADELREVLRRVLGAGRRWDEVEIVTTDPATHAPALDALCRGIGVPVTYATGLPVARSRHGVALDAYLRWISEDFPAEILRDLLSTGLLRPPSASADLPSLARRLRSLRIGWGRERYRERLGAALGHLDEVEANPEGDGEPEEVRAEGERRRSELSVLQALIDTLLDATPATPGPGSPPEVRVSPAELARGAEAFLALVPELPAETRVRLELGERLERIEATLRREAPFEAALATLRGWLRLRAAPKSEVEERRGGWTSEGGTLHLADLEHGGCTARPCTFVVGLDAGRFPSAGRTDPMLVDADRRALDGDPAPLSTGNDRLDEGNWRLAALLAGLRGRVTLSYCAWEAVEGRTVAPASAMLQALRLTAGKPALDYAALRETLAPLAGPVPGGRPSLDERDAWLASLDGGGATLLAGTKTVRDGFARLDRGLSAEAERSRAVAGSFRGVIEPRPDRLDPRRAPEIVVSASRAELLGKCPLAYLYRYVLSLRPPEDPERDPAAWLDPLQRGALLHDAYERTLRHAMERGVPWSDPELESLALRALHAAAERARERVPPPGEFVYEDELGRLEEDMRTFVALVREDDPAVLDLELDFGSEPGEVPTVELPGGGIRVRGRIDRLDALEDGSLRVVDYKTGSARRYGPGDPFHGGRRMQHWLYGQVARQLRGHPVRRMEYQFPTVRGEGQRRVYSAGALTDGGERLELALEQVARGHFVPTTDATDCKYCDFAEICRVRLDPWGNVDSPPATWAKEQADRLDVYGPMRRLRGEE